MDVLRKKLEDLFKKFGLSIDATANLKVINFLDVTFDLNRGTYKPYMKPNHIPSYVHYLSNHPPSIIKNIPLCVQRRLSSISSSKEVFDAAIPPYQEALDKAGYHHKLEYMENVENDQPRQKRKRKRNLVYFNPPFDKNVKTRIGREFLKIIDASFPPGNPLHGKLNRHNLKLSYSTCPNMKTQISRHNNRILNPGRAEEDEPCTCQRFECPMNGNCGRRNVVYQATVTSDDGNIKHYVGVAVLFKSRYYGHRTSINNPDYKSATTLSKYIWKLKEEKINFSLKWRYIDRGSPYNPITKRCNLCNKEKFYIIYRPHMATLNKRHELYTPCKHRLMPLLATV